MNLRRCLDQCSLALLRQIAEAHGVAVPEPPARGELVERLASRLLAPGYLSDYIGQLEPPLGLALALVGAEDGQLRGFLLERRLRHQSRLDETMAREVIGRAVVAGLLFRLFQATGPERGELFVLADELQPLLPAGQAARSAAPRPAEPPLERRSCAAGLTLFALASFLRRWRMREPRSGAAGGQLAALETEAGELVAELPGRSARERWTLMAHLAVQLGLFRRDDSGLELADGFEDWLELGPARERRLWEAYVGSERWNDLERAGSRSERFAGRTSSPREAREVVLGVVRELPAGTWLLASDVERAIREQVPDFLREGFDAATARLVDLESGEMLAGLGSWERLEGPTLQYMLAGPLFWLGVVDWGRSPDGWDRLRLTEDGVALLSGGELALLASPQPMALSDDLRLSAPARCDLGLLWRLEPYLSLERRAESSVYALSRASFGRGLAGGGSARDLLDRLEQAAGGRVPEPFAAALRSWDARAGRFKIRPMVALLAEDEQELSDVVGRLEGSGLLRARLGPRAASVTAARAPELAAALERLGHLPELDAALRLMAGRRAYAALVDQETLEALLFCLRLVRSLDPSLGQEIPNGDRLVRRLEQALGPIAGGRISRRARAVARRLRAGGRTAERRPLDEPEERMPRDPSLGQQVSE